MGTSVVVNREGGLTRLSTHDSGKVQLKDGTQLACPICAHDHFYKRMVKFEQDKLFDRHLEVVNVTCSRCGHIMLFDPYPGE